MSQEVIERIRSRGYWRFIVRPSEFIETRVGDFAALLSVVRRASVRFRGWDFPNVDSEQSTERNKDYIEQSVDWEAYKETWRIYQSGQFIYLRGFHRDWLDEASWARVPDDWAPGAELDAIEVVYTLTEAFEFAKRFAFTEAGAETVVVGVELRGLSNRFLYADPAHFAPFFREFRTQMPEWQLERPIQRADLAANSEGLSLDFARELFVRFGWTPATNVLEQHQQRLLNFFSGRSG